jgi:hypothetical protein
MIFRMRFAYLLLSLMHQQTGARRTVANSTALNFLSTVIMTSFTVDWVHFCTYHMNCIGYCYIFTHLYRHEGPRLARFPNSSV